MSDQKGVSEQREQAVVAASRTALNQSIENRPDLQARLAAARQAALAGKTAKRHRVARFAPWAGGLVAAGIALVIVNLPQNQLTPLPLDSADLVVELSGLDDTEWNMVQDFDFALWLSELDPDELENNTAI